MKKIVLMLTLLGAIHLQASCSKAWQGVKLLGRTSLAIIGGGKSFIAYKAREELDKIDIEAPKYDVFKSTKVKTEKIWRLAKRVGVKNISLKSMPLKYSEELGVNSPAMASKVKEENLILLGYSAASLNDFTILHELEHLKNNDALQSKRMNIASGVISSAIALCPMASIIKIPSFLISFLAPLINAGKQEYMADLGACNNGTSKEIEGGIKIFTAHQNYQEESTKNNPAEKIFQKYIAPHPLSKDRVALLKAAKKYKESKEEMLEMLSKKPSKERMTAIRKGLQDLESQWEEYSSYSSHLKRRVKEELSL